MNRWMKKLTKVIGAVLIGLCFMIHGALAQETGGSSQTLTIIPDLLIGTWQFTDSQEAISITADTYQRGQDAYAITGLVQEVINETQTDYHLNWDVAKKETELGYKIPGPQRITLTYDSAKEVLMAGGFEYRRSDNPSDYSSLFLTEVPQVLIGTWYNAAGQTQLVIKEGQIGYAQGDLHQVTQLVAENLSETAVRYTIVWDAEAYMAQTGKTDINPQPFIVTYHSNTDSLEIGETLYRTAEGAVVQTTSLESSKITNLSQSEATNQTSTQSQSTRETTAVNQVATTTAKAVTVSSKANLPQTGEASNWILGIVAAVAALVGLVLVCKRKKDQEV